jgi:hypothetical protein
MQIQRRFIDLEAPFIVKYGLHLSTKQPSLGPGISITLFNQKYSWLGQFLMTSIYRIPALYFSNPPIIVKNSSILE